MATMVESMATPRAWALSPIASSSSSSSSSKACTLLTAPKLPQFRGLKAMFGSSTRTLVKSPSSRSGIVRVTRPVVCESSETTLQLPSVTEETWKSLVLESDLPVVVEFWAPWCGPCRMIQPTIDELPTLYAGKLKVFKVNTDECSKIASDYGVRSVPTVMIFKKGEKKETVIGAVPKNTLTATIEKFL